MKNAMRILVPALLFLVLILPAQGAEQIYESWMENSPQLAHVTDEAGLLDDIQQQELESKARAIEERYGFGVYIITVDDFRDYHSYDVFEAAMALYKRYSLGCGNGKDGLLLLLSMDDRDYSLITYGDFGNLAFNDHGREDMTGFFLDDFADDDWYTGFSDYLDWSADYLEAAKNGEPYTDVNRPMSDSQRTKKIMIRIAIIFLLPLIVAGSWIGSLCSKMKSVARQTAASDCITGDLVLTREIDRYTHSTEIRQRISEDDSDGGGSSHSHSGGFSGTSGKF